MMRSIKVWLFWCFEAQWETYRRGKLGGSSHDFYIVNNDLNDQSYLWSWDKPPSYVGWFSSTNRHWNAKWWKMILIEGHVPTSQLYIVPTSIFVIHTTKKLVFARPGMYSGFKNEWNKHIWHSSWFHSIFIPTFTHSSGPQMPKSLPQMEFRHSPSSRHTFFCRGRASEISLRVVRKSNRIKLGQPWMGSLISLILTVTS